MENYFIIHGSFGTPYSNWIGWLFDFISSDGKEVYVPHFPIGVGKQNYENWSKLLKYYVDLGLITENTIIIGHSIAPVFSSKFLIENKIKIKKLISVCGFNNYLGINKDYDAVNESMYLMASLDSSTSQIVQFHPDKLRLSYFAWASTIYPFSIPSVIFLDKFLNSFGYLPCSKTYCNVF